MGRYFKPKSYFWQSILYAQVNSLGYELSFIHRFKH